MKFDQINEAKKYLPKVSPEEKIKALIKMKQIYILKMIVFSNNANTIYLCRLLDEATSLAHQQKDEQSLNRILAHCGPQNRNVSEKINQIKSEMALMKQK